MVCCSCTTCEIKDIKLGVITDTFCDKGHRCYIRNTHYIGQSDSCFCPTLNNRFKDINGAPCDFCKEVLPYHSELLPKTKHILCHECYRQMAEGYMNRTRLRINGSFTNQEGTQKRYCWISS